MISVSLPDSYASSLVVCPRCSSPFECGAKLPIPCDCCKLKLGTETLDYIQKLGYTGCLCNQCLQQIDVARKKG